MLPPKNVKLAEPVAAMFVRDVVQSVASCAEKAEDIEPDKIPRDNVVSLLPSTPCDIRQRTDVSDLQPDRSHRVCPAPPCALYVARPMLPPCTVTLADPVATTFTPRNTLSMPDSNDRPWLTLPCLAPALIPTRRLPVAPCPTWHRTDVSASHVVRSHPVRPTLIAAVYVVRPRLDPCTVTLDDPVSAPFVRLRRLAIPCCTE
jgi:hypothetical protein